jgi:hypothetical protein
MEANHNLTTYTQNLNQHLPTTDELLRETEKILDRTRRLHNFTTKFNHYGGHDIALATSTKLAAQQTQTPIPAEHLTDALHQNPFNIEKRFDTATLRKFTRQIQRKLELPYQEITAQHHIQHYNPVFNPDGPLKPTQQKISQLLGNSKVAIRRRYKDLLKEKNINNPNLQENPHITPKTLGHPQENPEPQNLAEHLAANTQGPSGGTPSTNAAAIIYITHQTT